MIFHAISSLSKLPTAEKSMKCFTQCPQPKKADAKPSVLSLVGSQINFFAVVQTSFVIIMFYCNCDKVPGGGLFL